MELIIATKEAITKYQDVLSVSLPAGSGRFAVKPGHAELFTQLEAGECRLKSLNLADQTVTIEGGVCHVFEDTITVIQ